MDVKVIRATSVARWSNYILFVVLLLLTIFILSIGARLEITILMIFALIFLLVYSLNTSISSVTISADQVCCRSLLGKKVVKRNEVARVSGLDPLKYKFVSFSFRIWKKSNDKDYVVATFDRKFGKNVYLIFQELFIFGYPCFYNDNEAITDIDQLPRFDEWR